MKQYSIKQLADLAGVTVRTLHYYDEIGLLRPHRRSKKDYRYYSRYELLRLQQILFYQELDYSLKSIKRLLDDSDFDFEASLLSHQKSLKSKIRRIQNLLKTIDSTINQFNHPKNMNDEQLYEGFASPEEGKKLTQEAQARWGDEVKKTNERIRKMGPQQWKKVKEEGEAIAQKLADLMGDFPVASKEVQNTIVAFHKNMEHFYPVDKERLRGLGQLYITDDRFRAHYDKYKLGLADFIQQAIEVYCA